MQTADYLSYHGMRLGYLETERAFVCFAPKDRVDSLLELLIRRLESGGVRATRESPSLQLGVSPSRRTSDSGGPGTKLVINGTKPSQVSFLLDGSDINDANNNTPGSAAGVMLGVDTLEEFRVLTNGYSAVYGRSAGGVVSAVTRSGTNEFHGSVFEFHRNSALDAKNYFDAKDAPIPQFGRNQYGATIAGPIVRNRTFFLGSFEGLRQNLGVTSRTVVPDANARQGIFPGQPPFQVNAEIPPYLALVPLPNFEVGQTANILRTCCSSTAGSVSCRRSASSMRRSSGILLHRKNDNLEATSRSLRRYTV